MVLGMGEMTRSMVRREVPLQTEVAQIYVGGADPTDDCAGGLRLTSRDYRRRAHLPGSNSWQRLVFRIRNGCDCGFCRIWARVSFTILCRLRADCLGWSDLSPVTGWHLQGVWGVYQSLGVCQSGR